MLWQRAMLHNEAMSWNITLVPAGECQGSYAAVAPTEEV